MSKTETRWRNISEVFVKRVENSRNKKEEKKGEEERGEEELVYGGRLLKKTYKLISEDEKRRRGRPQKIWGDKTEEDV